MKSVLPDRTPRLSTREDFYHVSPGRAESEGDLGSQELDMPPSPSLSLASVWRQILKQSV